MVKTILSRHFSTAVTSTSTETTQDRHGGNGSGDDGSRDVDSN